MVALRRTAVLLAVVTLGATLVPVAITAGIKAWQRHVAPTIVSDLAPLPCNEQVGLNVDSACLPWTAAHAPAPALSTRNVVTALSAAKRAESPRGSRLP
jgi:hypothetical protein